MNHTAINRFIKKLKQYNRYISKQQFKTLKGQAISGDIVGAERGLQKILQKGK